MYNGHKTGIALADAKFFQFVRYNKMTWNILFCVRHRDFIILVALIRFYLCPANLCIFFLYSEGTLMERRRTDGFFLF